MKRAIIILMAVVTFISCETKKTVNIIPKSDTMKTLCIYWYKNEPIYSVIFRVTKDTFKMVAVDNETSKKKWTKDTVYFIPVTDTVRDVKGLPLRDTLGAYKFLTQYFTYPNNLIWLDANQNIDSLMKAKNRK